MRSFTSACLALLLVVSGCARYSDNHRAGLLFAGGTATFVGAITAADGATCSTAGASAECEDASEGRALTTGLVLMVAGMATFGIAYYFKPKPAAADAPK